MRRPSETDGSTPVGGSPGRSTPVSAGTNESFAHVEVSRYLWGRHADMWQSVQTRLGVCYVRGVTVLSPLTDWHPMDKFTYNELDETAGALASVRRTLHSVELRASALCPDTSNETTIAELIEYAIDLEASARLLIRAIQDLATL